MRMKDKVGIVVGAGQTPGETIGNGRAAAILLAREGAKVLLVDRDVGSAEDTAAMIANEGGTAKCIVGDWTRPADCKAYVKACLDAWGRIDFLHNNVGIGANDGPPERVAEEAFDRIIQVNLKGCLFSCQAAIPVMREQQSGSIVNISSLAATAGAVPLTAYKISKIGMNALGQSLALSNAKYGIRVNTVMPGLMDTPMAIEGISRASGRPARRSARCATSRCRCEARWAADGTSAMRACSCIRMRRASSPASCCRSTAAKARRVG